MINDTAFLVDLSQLDCLAQLSSSKNHEFQLETVVWTLRTLWILDYVNNDRLDDVCSHSGRKGRAEAIEIK